MSCFHRWPRQAEAPPGALFDTMKAVIADGAASSSDIAFYFVHWVTDLAGAVPTYRFDVALGRDEELHLGSFAYPEAPPPPGGWGEDECLVEFW